MTKSDSQLIDKASSLPFLIVGFIAGVVLAVLEHSRFEHVLSYVWISLYTLMFLLAYTQAKSLTRLLVTTLVVSFAASVPFVWPGTPEGILILTCAYAINSFHIAYQEHRFNMPYESLFYAVWDTFVKLLIGAVFAGLCWLILLLWENLFELIGIHFFTDLFKKPWFIIWSFPFFASIGLYIATQTKKIVRNLRGIMLAICKFLLPVLAGIGILFILSWLFTVLLVHHTLNFKPNLFLAFSFITIIFTNGVFQEGLAEKPYSRFYLWLVHCFLIISPIFPLLALYALFLNTVIAQTSILKGGLNTLNFSTFINAILLLIYTLSYAIITTKHQKPWLKSIGKTNIILAILVIVVTLVLNNFWFSNASFNPGKIQPSHQVIQQQQLNKAKQQYKKLTKRLTKAKFVWHKEVNNALVLGYNRGQALKLCRHKMGGQYYGGVVKKGANSLKARLL